MGQLPNLKQAELKNYVPAEWIKRHQEARVVPQSRATLATPTKPPARISRRHSASLTPTTSTSGQLQVEQFPRRIRLNGPVPSSDEDSGRFKAKAS